MASLSRSLVAFAYVSDVLMRGGDIIEALAPLFAPIANAREGKRYVPAEFATSIEVEYGITTHPFVAEDWAPRLAKGGILEPLNANEAHCDYIYRRTDIGDVAQFERDVSAITERFRVYVTPHLERLQIPVPTDLDEQLFVRLKSVSFDDIARKPDVVVESDTTLTLIKIDPEPGVGTDTTPQMLDVAVASFVYDLQTSDPNLAKKLGDITLGALASEVILNFRVPPKKGDSFSGKVIFLDTPVVLDLLDLGTREEVEYAKMIVEDLKKMGAKIMIFSHCLKEFTGVIQATLDRIDKPLSLAGQLGARFRTDPAAVISARQVLRNPKKALDDNGIGIFMTDTHDLMKLLPQSAETDLLGQIRPFSNARIEAREVDAQSVATMIRLIIARRPRGGIMAYDKMFVTKNLALARKAAQILRHDGYLPEESDPPIITDRYMGGVLWLAKGTFDTAIPYKKLIANCAAAIRPRKDVIRRAHDEISRYDEKKAAEFEALMSDERCSLYLMKDTLGSAQVISSQNALAIYDEVRRATAAEVAAEAARRLNSREAELNAHIEQLEEERAAASSRELESYREIEVLKSANADLLKSVNDIERRQRTSDLARINTYIRRTRRVVWEAAIAVAGLLAAINFAATQIPNGSWGGVATYIIVIAVPILLTFMQIPELIFGGFLERRRTEVLRKILETRGESIGLDALQINWKAETATFVDWEDLEERRRQPVGRLEPPQEAD